MSGIEKNNELPNGWIAKKSQSHDKIYYFNTETGKSVWNHPLNTAINKHTKKGIHQSQTKKQKKKNTGSTSMENAIKTSIAERQTFQNKCNQGESNNIQSDLLGIKKKRKRSNYISKKSSNPQVIKNSNLKNDVLSQKVIKSNNETRLNSNQSLQPNNNKAIKKSSNFRQSGSSTKCDSSSSLKNSKLNDNTSDNKKLEKPIKQKKCSASKKSSKKHEMPSKTSNEKIITKTAHYQGVNKASKILLNKNTFDKSKLKAIKISKILEDKQMEDVDFNSSVNASSVDIFTEEDMDWEESPKEVILQEVATVRNLIDSSDSILNSSMVKNFHSLQNRPTNIKDQVKSYIVIDTNVFLGNLTFVKQLLKKCQEHNCILYIPWIVVQELDAFKDIHDGKKSLRFNSRAAIGLIHDCLKSQNTNIQTQTLEEYHKLRNFDSGSKSPDDKILFTCIYLVKSSLNVTLLSEDKNLRNKTCINGIQAENCSNILAKLEQKREIPANLNTSDFNDSSQLNSKVDVYDELFLDKNDKCTNVKVVESSHKNILFNNLLNQFWNTLQIFFEKLIFVEMISAFDEHMWLKIVIIKPKDQSPYWSLIDIFKIFKKHWIGVFGFFWHKKHRIKLEELAIFLNTMFVNNDFESLKIQLENSYSILEHLKNHNDYDGKLDESISVIVSLLSECNKFLEKNSDSEAHLVRTSPADELNQDLVIKDVLLVFQFIWSSINEKTAIICDVSNVQHCLPYTSLPEFPTLNECKFILTNLLSQIGFLISAMTDCIKEVEQNEINSNSDSVKLFARLLQNYCYVMNCDKEFYMLNAEFNVEKLILFINIPEKRILLENGLQQLKNFSELLYHCNLNLANM